MAIQPFPYQQDALKAIRNFSGDSALVLMATGLGKTLTAAWALQERLQERPKARVLILSHRDDINRQHLTNMAPILELTTVNSGFQKDFYRKQFVFSTFQSVSKRLERGEPIDPRMFDFVIIDEAHHTPAPTFARVVDHFRPQFRLGLSATGNRMDGQSLAPYFESTVFEMDLPTAVREGRLARLNYNLVANDMVDQGELSRAGHRYAIADLNAKLFPPRLDEEVANVVLEHLVTLDRPRTLGFLRSVEHARRFADVMPGSIAVHAKQADRRERIQSIRNGNVLTALTVDLFNEGIDLPGINTLFFLRPTDSEVVWLQQLGRGLRPDKPSVTVFDFVGSLERMAMLSEFAAVVDPEANSGNEDAQPRERIKLGSGGTLIFDRQAVDLVRFLESRRKWASREQILDSGLEAIAYLSALPQDHDVRMSNGKRLVRNYLDSDGLPTASGIDTASAAGVMPHTSTVINRFGGIEPFRDELAIRAGIIRTNTKAYVLEQAANEIAYIKADPARFLIERESTDGRTLHVRSLDSRGLLTGEGRSRAQAERGFKSKNQLIQIFGSIGQFDAALAKHLGVEHTEITKTSYLESAANEIDFLREHPEYLVIELRGKRLQAVGDDGLLTNVGVTQAVRSGRMEPLTTARLLFGDFKTFRFELGAHLGIKIVARVRAPKTEKAPRPVIDRAAIVESMVQEMQRHIVENTGEERAITAADIDSLINTQFIKTASLAKRTPSVPSVATYVGTLDDLRDAVAERLGLERFHIGPDEFIASCLKEMQFLKDHPESHIVSMRGSNGNPSMQRALDQDGILTPAGVAQAFKAGRLPWSNNAVREQIGDALSLKRAIADAAQLTVTEITNKTLLAAAKTEMEYVNESPDRLAFVWTVKGKPLTSLALLENGLLSNPGLMRAHREGRFPIGVEAVRNRFGSWDAFHEALAEYTGLTRRASRDEMVAKAIAETQRVRNSVELQLMQRSDGSTKRTLRRDGQLTRAGINRAFAESRMHSLNAIENEFGTLNNFTDVVSAAMGLEKQTDMQRRFLESSAAEIKYLEQHPEEQTVQRIKLGKLANLNALDRDGLLTAVGVEQAVQKRRITTGISISAAFGTINDFKMALGTYLAEKPVGPEPLEL